MPKEQVGTLTQRIVGKKGSTNFAKAMRFVQKPWWKVDPHYFNQRVEEASQEQGLTIHRMVTKQRDRVKSKIGTTVGGKLKKYSLTTNTPSNVEEAVKQSPFSGLHVKDLTAIVNSYLGIVDGATNVEKATPEFKTASQLVDQVKLAIHKQEVERSSLPSRTSSTT